MESKLNDPLIHPTDDRLTMKNGVDIRMGSHSGSNSMISVVHPAELSSETQQTPGSLRLSAIAALNGIASSLWAGIFVVEPSGQTGIHHHGEQDTVVYVLEGEACIRWGDFGEHSITAGAGDFLHVPSCLPHQELNPSQEHPFDGWWCEVHQNRSLSIWLTTSGLPLKSSGGLLHIPNSQHEKEKFYE